MSSRSSPPPPLNTGGSSSGRRLSSCRRGSVAAPDPFGTVHDNDRSMSSTLTILRAPSLASADREAEERARRRRSTGSHVRSPSGGSAGGRISFAFTAFSPQKKGEHGAISRSASLDPTRPSSPLARSNSFTELPARTQLTPVQVYELAQQCNYPESQPPTPGADAAFNISTPVAFTSLPDTVYLPFLDRPREVQGLISTPLMSRLFSLLAQTFPSSSNLHGDGDADPRTWTYVQLEKWLTKVDRDTADDIEWVHKARKCISARSELIWERVKGALGVPPELDAPSEKTDTPTGPGHDDKDANDFDDFDDSYGETWVEPVVTSATPSPRPLSQSPTTEFPRSPSLTRQSMNRMDDISEDAPEPEPQSEHPSSSPVVHGLRVITAPSDQSRRRESSPLPTSAGSFSHPHVPYDAAAERGPGHPLFPSSFARLALGPTLSANNPSLRRLSAPPASAYPLSHSNSRQRRKVPSWAEGWDLRKQEYAVSTTSTGSRRSE